MRTACAIARVRSQSNPTPVPSRSIEVKRISPAPRSSASFAHATALFARGHAAPGNKCLETGFGSCFGIRAVALGVNRDNHRLRSEPLRDAGNQRRVGDGGGVDADLVRARVEDGRGVVERPHSTSNGKGNEKFPRCAANGFKQRVALLVRGGDVEEHDFIRARRAVRGSQAAGSPASRRSRNCVPFTTRPASTSKQAMMRLVSICLS